LPPPPVAVPSVFEAYVLGSPFATDAEGEADEPDAPPPASRRAPASAPPLPAPPARLLPEPVAVAPRLRPAPVAPSLSPAEQWLRASERKTLAALAELGFRRPTIQSSRLTPNAALLRFKGEASFTVPKVEAVVLQLLTSHGIAVVDVRPEPGAVTLVLERPTREIVLLEDVWDRWAPPFEGGDELLIGQREADGSVLTLSPGRDHAPHMLIAGATGSGKSVLMQVIMLSIAATNTPEQAQIVLVDPKQGIDYGELEALPHLDGPIIADRFDAIDRIDRLVKTMDDRYDTFRNLRRRGGPVVRTLAEYNASVDPSERLPVIWLIHDEFADWMLDKEHAQAVGAHVARLGMRARAAGIRLVFAAQRPDKDVMPPQLRDNLGSRLILKVAAEGTSEIALGEKGAEKLLGKGHLLARVEGSPGLIYAQVPFAKPEVMARMVEEIVERDRARSGT
jgi:DNA segregation ATPase FtsK/SpoIIIE, S-DNA-T family